MNAFLQILLVDAIRAWDEWRFTPDISPSEELIEAMNALSDTVAEQAKQPTKKRR